MEPATERQLQYLEQLGQDLGGLNLTKAEASELIAKLCADQTGPEPEPEVEEETTEEYIEHEAYRLHEEIDSARASLNSEENSPLPDAEEEQDLVEREKSIADCRADLKLAQDSRIEFWLLTFEKIDLSGSYISTSDYYDKWGKRFKKPKRAQVEAILDALDSSAAPAWDKDHPELFYRTLEINFPVLLRE